MRYSEIKLCKKCGKMYKKYRGGVVVPTAELMDEGLCRGCIMEKRLEGTKKILSFVKKIPFF